MAKYKLTINDADNVLINTIPTQPEDGFEEGTKVTINVKYGPHGNLFGAIDGGTPVQIIDKAVFEVTMDSAKTVTLYKKSDEPSGVATPTITPNGGEVVSGSSVTIACETDDADIFYTTNGSTPTAESTKYTSAITVTEAVTIKAIAIKDDLSSNVVSASFTIAAPKAATPTIVTQPVDSRNPTVVAEVSDDGTLSYQWYTEHDEPIEGETNAAFANSASHIDEWVYCIVTNTLGSSTATAKTNTVQIQ